MKPSPADYLEDMLDAIRRAHRHVGNADEAAFVANEMAVDAVAPQISRALERLRTIKYDVGTESE